MIILTVLCFVKYIKCEENIISLDCKYPHFSQLNNGCNLLYCSKGIYIYNSEFDHVLYNHTFDIEVSSTDVAQYTVIHQFPDDEGGNIIVLGKNMFYYLKNDGDLIFKTNFSLTDNAVLYYTLAPYKSNNNNNFILGIFDSSNQLILYDYKINSIDKKIEIIDEIKPSLKNSKGWSPTFFYGIECKRMKSDTYDNILACFLCDTSIGEISVILFEINDGLKPINDLLPTFFTGVRPKYYKVIISQSKSLALMCFRTMQNQMGNCTYFDTNLNSFSTSENYINNCGDNPYNSILTYVKSTQEYVFSCINQYNVRLAKFDKNLNLIDIKNNDESIQLSDCIINFHDVIYLNQYKNYILLYDSSCMRIDSVFLPDKFNPDLSFLSQTTSPTSLKNSVPKSNDISIINTKISTISKPNLPISTTLLNEKYTTSPNLILTTLLNIQPTSLPQEISTTLLNEKYTTSPNLISTTLLNIQPTSLPQQISTTTLINEQSTSSLNSILTTLIKTQSTSSPKLISTTIIKTQPTSSPNPVSTTLINEQSTSSPKPISTTLIKTTITSSPNSISTILITTQLTTSPNSISTTLIKTQPTSFIKGQNSLIETQSTSSPNTIQSSLINIKSTFSKNSLLTTLMKAQTTYISSSPNISPSTSISTLFSTSLSSSPIISKSTSLTNPTSLHFSSDSLTSLLTNPSNSFITSSSNIIYSNISPPSSLFQQSNIISTIQNSDDNTTEVLNEEICDPDYFYKNILTNKCQKVCSFDEFVNEVCYIIYLNENNILNITQDIRNYTKLLDINKNTNSIIKGSNALYQIVSSEAMNQNKNKNISIIDFSKCEEILKKKENIDYILILKVDIYLSNSTNIVLKYEAYNPYTLNKLNLSVCNKVKINTLVPYSLAGKYIELYSELNEMGYDLNNPNDTFYQDICCPFTTEYKTDILLNDRRLNYYQNITFCEEGCTYKEYDYAESKVKCECNIKTEFDKDILNVRFYSNLVLNTFFKIEHFSNIMVLKCYKLVFSKEGQDKNYGSCIFLFIIASYIILMIFFYVNFKSEVLRIFNYIIEKKYMKSISAPIKNKNIRKNKKHGSCLISKNKISELISTKRVSNDISNLKIHKKQNKNKFDKLNFKKIKEKEKNINNSSKEIFNSKNKSNTFSVSDKIFKFGNKMSTIKNDIINNNIKNKNKNKKKNNIKKYIDLVVMN